MSGNDTAKADQIALHLYTKLFFVVHHARATAQSPAKVDKWFNLETPDSSELLSKETKDRYKAISTATNVPPLEIQVFLTVPDLSTSNQVLVHVSDDQQRTRVDPTPARVLLEKWNLSFEPNDFNSTSSSSDTEEDIAPPTMYKHGIPLFRSLFSLLRLLPSWNVHKKLVSKRRNNPFAITVQVAPATQQRTLTFDHPLSTSYSQHAPVTLPRSSHSFPPFPHPSGNLCLQVTYLTKPTFRLDDLESLLSSRFLASDAQQQQQYQHAISTRTLAPQPPPPPSAGAEDVDFVPTLTKNQQRDSLTISSASAGTQRGGSPIPQPRARERLGSQTRRSPPSVVGTPPRPSSVLSSGAGLGSLGRPSSLLGGISRTSSAAPPTSSSGTPPSSSLSPPPNIPRASDPSGLGMISRLRKESFTTSSSSSLPLQSSSTATPAGGVPKRPALTVNPFKSATVSSSNLPVIPIPLPSNATTTSSSSIPSSSGTGRSIPTSSSPLRAGQLPATVTSRLSPPTQTAVQLPPPPGSTSPPGSPRMGTRPFVSSSLSSTSTPFPTSSQSKRASTEGVAGIGMGVPSSLGAAGTGTGPARKRYSSSFGHRYGGSGGSAATSGSGGSGPGASGSIPSGGGGIGRDLPLPEGGSGSESGSSNRGSRVESLTGAKGKEREREGTATAARTGFLGTTTDDDDISSFVMDIDRRKPLRGSLGGASSTLHSRESSYNLEQGEDTASHEREDTLRGVEAGMGGGEVLTSPDDIDAKLREMNEVFMKSLEGLGSGRRQQPSVSSRGAAGASTARRAPSNITTTGSAPGTGPSASPSPSPISRGRGTGLGLTGMHPPASPGGRRFDSTERGGSGSGSNVASAIMHSGASGGSGGSGSQGSEEVIGRMELDYGAAGRT